ncbi:hypothetical protein [Nocardioides sp.]|uniref:hypothetical protein n=1 Tax=Nocardioides sp. TaxID=35761 RepID=UPI00260CADBB|nr:hypothetical protein [Nocardioides sp.]
MVRFGRVEFWPSGGREDRPWADAPATDALVRSACRVAAAYSEALADENLEGPQRSLRFFSHPHEADEVQLQVDTDKPTDWESGTVFVPEAVVGLSAGERGRLVLDLIHDAVVQLAPHRGWPLEAIERVRARVLAQDLEFRWASSWKTSPDRSMTARAVYRVDDDGWGRVAIEVRDRTSEVLIARSAPALAYNALVNFRASAKTLRWTKRTVHLVPRVGSPHGGVVVTLDPDRGEIHQEWSGAHNHESTPGVAVPAIVRAAYGSDRMDATPGVGLVMGFGLGVRGSRLIWDSDVDLTEAIELALFDRIGAGEAGVSEWLDGLPVEIWLEYDLPEHLDLCGGAFGIRLRRTARCLSVTVLRDGSWIGAPTLTGEAVEREVSDLVEQVMAAVAARAEKGPVAKRK